MSEREYEPPKVTDLGTVEELLRERDQFRTALFDLSVFANVHRSFKPDTTPREVATWVEQSVTSTVDGLKKTITQLQQDNNRLVDERRAADIHYRDMKVVYIAHPLSGPDRDANIARASRWCAWAFKSGYSPVADWIVLASQLDESYREQGLRADCALIKRCDQVWLCGGRVSEGMRIEAAAARLVGIPVKDMTVFGEEPPEGLLCSIEWLQP